MKIIFRLKNACFLQAKNTSHQLLLINQIYCIKCMHILIFKCTSKHIKAYKLILLFFEGNQLESIHISVQNSQYKWIITTSLKYFLNFNQCYVIFNKYFFVLEIILMLHRRRGRDVQFSLIICTLLNCLRSEMVKLIFFI